MQLLKELEKRKAFLKRLINQLENNISKYPDGTIQCNKDRRNNNILRFHIRKNGRESYLSERKESKLIRLLLRKRYESEALIKYSEKLRLITGIYEYEREIIGKINTNFLTPYYFEKYIRPIELSVNEKICEFNKLMHGSSSTQSGQYRVTTKEGVLVKSKAEQIIADELFDNKIPFKYELGLKCMDHSFRSPDFTVMNPSTGKLFYWEHFGMMDRLDYVRDKVDKMNSYSLTNIIPGDNLILTLADDRKLDVRGFTDQVRRIIDTVLK